MQVFINNSPKLTSLRFGRYLPRAFKKANPFLGSWVSPTNINFPNRQTHSDYNTLNGRVDFTAPHAVNNQRQTQLFARLVNEAFRAKWFNWRLVVREQVIPYEKTQFPQDNYKLLLIKFDLGLFQGESSYRRYLTICAVVEYFNLVYKNKLQTKYIVFNHGKISPGNRGLTRPPFNKYSSKYKNTYFTLSVFGLLGSLSLLGKLYKLSARVSHD